MEELTWDKMFFFALRRYLICISHLVTNIQTPGLGSAKWISQSLGFSILDRKTELLPAIAEHSNLDTIKKTLFIKDNCNFSHV
jgi:hypothetical protein